MIGWVWRSLVPQRTNLRVKVGSHSDELGFDGWMWLQTASFFFIFHYRFRQVLGVRARCARHVGACCERTQRGTIKVRTRFPYSSTTEMGPRHRPPPPPGPRAGGGAHRQLRGRLELDLQDDEEPARGALRDTPGGPQARAHRHLVGGHVDCRVMSFRAITVTSLVDTLSEAM